MAESVSRREFFGKEKMHNMAAGAVTKHDYNHAHNEHMSLQDCTCHPIAFHSKMLGDTMHLHQALRQPDSCQFVDSVVNVTMNQQAVLDDDQAVLELFDKYCEL